MSRRKTKIKPGPRPNLWLIGGAFIAAAGLSYLVWDNTRPKPEAFVGRSPGGIAVLPTPAGRDRAETFSVSDHVGERALPFSVVNVNGQTYTITPGNDGQPMAIVFYMGFQ